MVADAPNPSSSGGPPSDAGGRLPRFLLWLGLAAALLFFFEGWGGADGSRHRVEPKAGFRTEAPAARAPVGESETVGATPSDEAPASGGEATASAPASEADLAALGERLYTGKAICFSCHGRDAAGTQIAPDLRDDQWLHVEPPATVEKVAAVIISGVMQPKEHPGIMPPKAGVDLSDEEVRALAVYLLQLGE